MRTIQPPYKNGRALVVDFGSSAALLIRNPRVTRPAAAFAVREIENLVCSRTA
jgi:hypothetical protein